MYSLKIIGQKYGLNGPSYFLVLVLHDGKLKKRNNHILKNKTQEKLLKTVI